MSAATDTPASVLVARSRPVHHTGDLLDLLPNSRHVSSWVRDGQGLVGWGEVVRVHTVGPARAADAAAWWSQHCAAATVLDEVGVRGSGLVAFTSMAFADSPGESVLLVPRVVAGRRGEVTWVTEIGPREVDDVEPVSAPVGLRYSADAHPALQWRSAVRAAVDRIRAGEVAKVVLARDLLAEAEHSIDPRFVLRNLASRYPQCWSFAVDGLVGATPELLVRRDGRRVSSRVLAGTTWPRDGVGEQQLAAALLHSAKDRDEHAYAVESLVAALRKVCTQVQVGAVEVLHLRNVAHLSTTVTGELTEAGTDVLALAGVLHPTAAVGGTPTGAAVALIDELEQMDRGRYAGPVGWVDAHGDGELGLALRSAELRGSRARLFAGCGIVAGSDPDEELAETDAKFVAVRDALEGVTG